MPFKYGYILPILCPVWFYLTFIITYVISALKNHVSPLFPYISDTGTWSPESCIFGVMLNIGAVLLGLTMYIRYRQVKYVLDKDSSLAVSLEKRNRWSFWTGLIACVGVCMVGNFQESNVLSVHILAAILAFGMGSIYQCLETRTSFQLYPIVDTRRINYLRVLCCVISVTTFIVTCLFAVLFLLQFTGDDPTKWTRDDGGYIDHFISAVSEWILAVTTMLFLSLFTNEFKKLSFTEPLLTERISAA